MNAIAGSLYISMENGERERKFGKANNLHWQQYRCRGCDSEQKREAIMQCYSDCTCQSETTVF